MGPDSRGHLAETIEGDLTMNHGRSTYAPQALVAVAAGQGQAPACSSLRTHRLLPHNLTSNLLSADSAGAVEHRLGVFHYSIRLNKLNTDVLV